VSDRVAPAGAVDARLLALRTRAVAAGLLAGLLVFLILAVAPLVSGCGGSSESPVGMWASANLGESLELTSDGTAIFTRKNGVTEELIWEADGTSLALGVVRGDTRTFGYSIKEGVLTLTFPGEKPATYTRVGLQGG
jgi:hypothetical protein